MPPLAKVRAAGDAYNATRAQLEQDQKALYAAIRAAYPDHSYRAIAEAAGTGHNSVAEIVRGERT